MKTQNYIVLPRFEFPTELRLPKSDSDFRDLDHLRRARLDYMVDSLTTFFDAACAVAGDRASISSGPVKECESAFEIPHLFLVNEDEQIREFLPDNLPIRKAAGEVFDCGNELYYVEFTDIWILQGEVLSSFYRRLHGSQIPDFRTNVLKQLGAWATDTLEPVDVPAIAKIYARCYFADRVEAQVEKLSTFASLHEVLSLCMEEALVAAQAPPLLPATYVLEIFTSAKEPEILDFASALQFYNVAGTLSSMSPLTKCVQEAHESVPVRCGAWIRREYAVVADKTFENQFRSRSEFQLLRRIATQELFKSTAGWLLLRPNSISGITGDLADIAFAELHGEPVEDVADHLHRAAAQLLENHLSEDYGNCFMASSGSELWTAAWDAAKELDPFTATRADVLALIPVVIAATRGPKLT